MDFDFTQEQVMLRDLAREFLTRESSPRAVRSVMEDSRGFSDSTWQQMAEMGLQGLAIDAGYGGQGLGMVDLALVLDEMGRAAYPGPYFATVVLAASAIAESGQANPMARYLPDIAAGRTRATLALLESSLSWTARSVSLRAEHLGGGGNRGALEHRSDDGPAAVHLADYCVFSDTNGVERQGRCWIGAVHLHVLDLGDACRVTRNREHRRSIIR